MIVSLLRRKPNSIYVHSTANEMLMCASCTRSNFLSPVALELPRWQQFMVLVTMFMGVLVVDGK